MRKVVAGFIVIAGIVAFALLNNKTGPDEQNEAAMPASSVPDTPAPSPDSLAENPEPGSRHTVPAQFKSPSRVTQSTTGTTVVMPGGGARKPVN